MKKDAARRNAAQADTKETTIAPAYVETRSTLAKLYYLYEITTAVYMLEPWEKAIVNSIFASLILFFIYSLFAIFPSQIRYIYKSVLQLFS